MYWRGAAKTELVVNTVKSKVVNESANKSDRRNAAAYRRISELKVQAAALYVAETIRSPKRLAG